MCRGHSEKCPQQQGDYKTEPILLLSVRRYAWTAIT